ncbi:MAG TPA: hypothetical protein DCQ93_05740 [Bacteroidetes bacterium]|nr:hypothetical protein [Bacteroidota bacterium]
MRLFYSIDFISTIFFFFIEAGVTGFYSDTGGQIFFMIAFSNSKYFFSSGCNFQLVFIHHYIRPH